MADRSTLPTTPAAPLLEHIGEGRGKRAAFVKEIGISHANLNNWVKRGIPSGWLMRVAAHMGLTAEQYVKLAEGKEPANHEGSLPMRDRLAETSPGGVDEQELLGRVVTRWPSLPSGTKLAIACLVDDVARFVEGQTNDAISRFGVSKDRAENKRVEQQYGLPGRPDRRKSPP